MTRVNVGIRPEELPDKLLLAEHKEITRIPNAVREGKLSADNMPIVFTLGEGHVKFFRDKILYLARRYDALLRECKYRGFDVTDKSDAFTSVSMDLFGWYDERPIDRELVIERILSNGFKLLEVK